MARQVLCDRCGEAIVRKERHLVWASKKPGGTQDRLEYSDQRKRYDLCVSCWEEHCRFMNEIDERNLR